MSSNDPDHIGDHADAFDALYRDAAARSELIIRWLPLLAANDFLEQDDNWLPVA